MIGEESLDIYNTLTFSQDEVNKIHPLIQKFDQYFAPKKNIAYQTYLFYTCTQSECTFGNFQTDIKNKAKACEFRSLEDSLIRDRIVCGIDSKEMRERLLRDSELTLNKAANIVRAFKVGLSPSKKNCVICFTKSALEIMKNAFYFILKALFVLKIFKFLS